MTRQCSAGNSYQENKGKIGVPDPFGPREQAWSLMNHALARAKGMELASGRGKMRPLPWDEWDFKDEPWEGSVPLPDERRNPILIWGRDGKGMKTNDPKDGFAGYGRHYKGFEYLSDIY